MRRAGVLVTVCLLLMSGIVLVFPRPAKGGNVSPPFVETTLTAALGQAISLDVLPDGSGRFLIVEKDGCDVYCESGDTFAQAIDVRLVSTSEIKISVLVGETDLERAVRALHGAFGLAKPPGTTG